MDIRVACVRRQRPGRRHTEENNDFYRFLPRGKSTAGKILLEDLKLQKLWRIRVSDDIKHA